MLVIIMKKIDGKDLKEQSKKKAKAALEDYKKFALKGNVMDLAIGMVMGSAFTAIVTAVVDSLISPLIGALTSNVDLADLTFTVKGVEFGYGAVLNALISFLIVSLVMFVIVKALATANKKEEIAEEVTTKECPYCLSTIPLKATRCPHCTSVIEEKAE